MEEKSPTCSCPEDGSKDCFRTGQMVVVVVVGDGDGEVCVCGGGCLNYSVLKREQNQKVQGPKNRPKIPDKIETETET